MSKYGKYDNGAEEPQKKTSFNDIVSLDEASKMLGVSRQTMYSYNHKRVIPYLHANHGKKVYYYKEDLLKFINNGYKTNNEMKEIKGNVYDSDVPFDEWSRRKWITSYIEKQDNTIIPDDFGKFENFCKTGLMIESEDFEDFVKFCELKAYLQEEAKCEQDADVYVAFDRKNPMHKHIDKARNFIKGLQKLDERIKYQEMFVLDFWSQISDKEKYETFLKTFDEKTLSIANEIIDKKNELRKLEREKQDVLREIQYVKTELKRKENQLKKLNEKI